MYLAINVGSEKMLKKNFIIIVMSAFLLLNITSFFDFSIENILNLGLSISMIVLLYFFILKIEFFENIRSKVENDEKKAIEHFCMGIVPIITLIYIYLYPGGILNYLILLSLQGVIYLLFKNVKVACITQIIFSYILYVTSEVLTIVRGTPFMPVDVLSVNIAVSMSGNYDFVISSNLVRATLGVVFLIFILVKLLGKEEKNRRSLKEASIYLIIFVTTFTSIWLMDETTFYNRLFGVNESIKVNGMILNFCINMKYLNLEEPEGYTQEYAEEIIESYSGSEETINEELPNIIVIMNESFCDLEKIVDLDTNINPLEYFYSLKENTVRGNVVVPIVGSRTSISEMEFLTGFPLEIFKENSVPYVQHIKGKTNSLLWDFKELGYKTIAMHPFYENAYNRNKVYPYFGFDDFISIEDFVGNSDLKGYKDLTKIRYMDEDNEWNKLDCVRNYVSDRANYKKIIEVYENNPGKTFLFNATIQNHAAYDYQGDNFETTVMDKNINNAEMNQYLSLLYESDKALEEFIAYFEQNSGEKTMVVFFGDHYPWLKDAYNQNLPTDKDGMWTKDIDAKMTTIPFFIWANYDIEEKNIERIGLQYLSVLLKQTAGIPLTAWDKVRRETMEKYPAFNFVGTYTHSGELLGHINELDDNSVSKYKILQYYFLKENLQNE